MILEYMAKDPWVQSVFLICGTIVTCIFMRWIFGEIPK